MKKLTFVFLIVSLIHTISGCIFSNNEYHYAKDTLGAKLIDLENARKEGGINEAEYKELKQKIIDSERLISKI